MHRIRLSIDGMSCGHCLNAVQRAIAAVPGARAVQVRMGEATVEVDADETATAVASAVTHAGYNATLLPGSA